MLPSLQYIDEYDPHFKIFHELMAFKVREILLVSSPYDAYIMEEDGSMASRIINEYHGLNLSQPPRITRVATADQALALLNKRHFDLVVTMPHLGGDEVYREIRRVDGSLPVIVSSGFSRKDVMHRFAGRSVDGFIQKPYRSQDLYTVIRQVLEPEQGSE